jgi:phosphate transport system substrate-binding protein
MALERFAYGLSVLAIGVAAATCSKSGSSAKENSVVKGLTFVKVAGSTAVLPLVTDAANRYMAGHTGVVVEVEGGGSRLGISRVVEGGITIGTSDIQAPPEAHLEDHKIAVVGFAAMANSGPFNASITSITMEQLRGVLSGRIKDWSELGGTSQPIVFVNRAKNSGTRGAVGAVVLGGDKFGLAAEEQESSALVQTSLREKVGAFSYLALSYRHDALKVFAIDGVEPTPEAIEKGTYPIWSYEHMFTTTPASEGARSFIDFFLSQEVQQTLVPSKGFIAIASMKTSRNE